MSSIPSGLPTIGPASVILLSQQGINSAADVLRRGTDGHDGLPGMGPAKWAVLWQWACSSLSAEDIRPEMEQSLIDLKQLDKTLSNNMQSIEGKTSAQLQACFDHTRFGHILGRDHWYRDILQQRSDLSNAVRDFSGEIAQVRSRIEKQVQVLNQEINARLMLERQERDRQMAAEAARRDMMKALGWLLKVGIPVLALYWACN
jgi:hypothetical protein